MTHRPKSLRELPVEPLSDARWARVEEGLFDALDAEAQRPVASPPASRRPYLIAASAVVLSAAAALLIVLFLRKPSEPAATLTPSRFVTGSEASHVVWGQSEIDVLPDTAVVASGDDAHGILLVLEKGGVDCEVAPRAGRPAFVVQAGDTRVRVVGTHFRVERADGGGVRVAVSHGIVEVSRGGSTVMVAAGQQWPSAAPPIAPPPTTAAIAPSASAATSGEPTARAIVPVRSTDRQVYEAAARREVSDPEGAMVTYRTLAAGGGPWAANALFASGRLSAERGRRADAKRLLGEYLARYPRGPNAEDARRLLDGMK